MRKPRRHFRQVSVAPAGDGGEGFVVTLDGNPALTPARRRLVLPTRALADAVGGEWAAQSREIDPLTMPLTRLAATALDRVALRRHEVLEQIVAFCESDLLAYWAEAPPRLVTLQARLWQPLLGQAQALWGVTMRTTLGVAPVRQSPETRARLDALVAARGDFSLAGLHAAASVTGSIVLALLLDEGAIDARTAWQAAQAEVEFQVETWGRDPEAEAAAEARRSELLAARAFLDLLRG